MFGCNGGLLLAEEVLSAATLPELSEFTAAASMPPAAVACAFAGGLLGSLSDRRRTAVANVERA